MCSFWMTCRILLSPHAGNQTFPAPPARERHFTLVPVIGDFRDTSFEMWLQALQEEIQAQKVKMKQKAAEAEGTRGLALPRATWPQAIHSTSLGLNWLTCKNGRKKETGWHDFKWLGRAASFLENICGYKSSDALKAGKVHLWQPHTAASPWVGAGAKLRGPVVLDGQHPQETRASPGARKHKHRSVAAGCP